MDPVVVERAIQELQAELAVLLARLVEEPPCRPPRHQPIDVRGFVGGADWDY